MKTLGIAGAGRFGRLAEDLAKDTGLFDRCVFFDDTAEVDGERIAGTFDDIEDWVRSGRIDALAIAVGYKHFHTREALYRQFRGRISFPRLIHPTAFVSPRAVLHEGVMIYSMANVEVGAELHPNVTVFNQTSITHDVTVGAHTFLSVGVGLGGGVSIGANTFIGVNASIVNDISIGDRCVICGGTLLTKSIADDTCVIGNPYRIISQVEL